MKRTIPKTRHKYRPAVLRIIRVAKIITNGRRPTVRKIAAELGYSYRTISRDIAFLRDELDHKIHYDQYGHKLYYLVKPEPIVL